MSDDAINLVAKLDDNKYIDLSNFLAFWESKNFIIENRTKTNCLSMYEESIYIPDSKESYPLNFENYNSIYLPNPKAELDVTFGGGNSAIAHYCIYKPGSNKETRSTFTTQSRYEFFISITHSFLVGRVLVISMMYRQSLLLGYDEGNGEYGGCSSLFFDLIIEYLHPIKIMEFNLADSIDNFLLFFVESDKNILKKNLKNEKMYDTTFHVNFFNINFIYQDYIDLGLINTDELYFTDYFIILYGQKYSNSFDAPIEILNNSIEYVKKYYSDAKILKYY